MKSHPLRVLLPRRALLCIAVVFSVACSNPEGPLILTYLTAIEDLRAATSLDDAAISAEFERLRVGSVNDPAQFRSLFESLRSSNVALLDGLRAIQPPGPLVGMHAELVRGLVDYVEGIDAALIEVNQGNVNGALEVFSRAAGKSGIRQTGAMLQIRRIARGYGVEPG